MAIETRGDVWTVAKPRRCLSISFYLWPNIMLLGNSRLYRSYQININSSANGSNVYAESHHFPLMTHRETQRNVPGRDAKAARHHHSDRETTQTPVNGVYLSGRHNLLWLNGCWNIDKAFPRHHIKCYLTKEGSRTQTIKSLIWSGRSPRWQVKTKAAYAHTLSVTRERRARQAIPAGTLSPVPQTKPNARRDVWM